MSSEVPSPASGMQGMHAGLVSRLVANTVDALVAALFLGAGYLGVVLFRLVTDRRTFTWPAPSFTTLFVLFEIVLALYLGLTWSATGRSAGKQVMGLRVVDHRGARMHLLRALLRALFCVAFPVGLLWVAVNRANHSVQDIVLRSSVIYDWRRHAPTPEPSPATAVPTS